MGFTFLLLEAHHALSALFALPAGYSDMTIGATATWVAWKLAKPRYRDVLLWQLLGIADLLVAVSMGTTAWLFGGPDASMVPMTVLPLSLIPTFLVPLFGIFHVICIVQAKAWKVDSQFTQRMARPRQPHAI